MSTLDEITNEKQRISEALTRVAAQREKLISQLSELEATERVLARHTKGVEPRKTASAKMPIMATEAAAPARPRGRRRTTTSKPAGGRRTPPTLDDRVPCSGNGQDAAANHRSVQGGSPEPRRRRIARHKRAGRIEERDGKRGQRGMRCGDCGGNHVTAPCLPDRAQGPDDGSRGPQNTGTDHRCRQIIRSTTSRR